jgi:hypothetical protein
MSDVYVKDLSLGFSCPSPAVVVPAPVIYGIFDVSFQLVNDSDNEAYVYVIGTITDSDDPTVVSSYMEPMKYLPSHSSSSVVSFAFNAIRSFQTPRRVTVTGRVTFIFYPSNVVLYTDFLECNFDVVAAPSGISSATPGTKRMARVPEQ